MKNKVTKRPVEPLCILLTLAAIFMITFIGRTITVQAAEKFPTVPKTKTLLYYPSMPDGKFDDSTFVWGGVVYNISNLKSSNPKVATLKNLSDDYNTAIDIVLKKAGTTKVSFTLTKGKESKRYTVKVTVHKYENPVKAFKIGKKNYAANFKKKSYLFSAKKISGKITITAAKGWKVKKIQKNSINNKGTQKFTTLKNGKNYTFTPFSQLIVTCQNKKTKVVEKIFLQVGQP